MAFLFQVKHDFGKPQAKMRDDWGGVWPIISSLKMRDTVIRGLFWRTYSWWLVANGWLSFFQADLRGKHRGSSRMDFKVLTAQALTIAWCLSKRGIFQDRLNQWSNPLIPWSNPLIPWSVADFLAIPILADGFQRFLKNSLQQKRGNDSIWWIFLRWVVQPPTSIVSYC